MQKLVQRTSAAKVQAARRAQRQSGKRMNEMEFAARQQLKSRNKTASMYVKSERERRREVYEAGVLAPRYDVGENVATYATVDPYVTEGVELPWSQHKKEKCPFAVGDRVVIISGRDKGKIGRISSVKEKAGHVKVAGLNQGDYFVPEYARVENSDPRTIVPVPLPLPYKDVRLVHAIRNPETGIFQDVVVDKVQLLGAHWDKKTREYVRGTRIIPALGQEIPWPKTEESTEETTHDDDTYRINVDEKSDRPYLLQPPMPPSVIDELRNKYSVFRDRHEDWYIKAKRAEDRARQSRGNLASMVSTPLMELKEKTRQDKMAADLDLTQEQLAKIGQVMAEERLKAARSVAQSQQQQ